MSAESFADIYYRLYTDDMPVFVTADSILHAWHRSFDAFLIDMETQILSPTLDLVLERTILKCQSAISTAHTAESKEVRAILDVELFLTAARSLLQGDNVAGISENAMKLESLLLLVHAEETTHTDIFSAEREIDFSQFKPPWHYTKCEQLQRYFRAMVWLGTVDFHVAGGEHEDEDLHQLHCAVLLVGFLQSSSSMETMKTVDLLISSLVADGGLGADSLSPNQLEHLLSETKFLLVMTK